MMARKLSAGDQTESMCTKCKSLLNHTIVAMVDGRIVRVKCNTCGSEHNYRPQKEAVKAPVRRVTAVKTAASARTKVKRDPEASDREEWEALSRTRDMDKSVPYDMNGAFRLNDLVNHPVFGVGLVCSRNESKMEVLFQAGRKLLRCK